MIDPAAPGSAAPGRPHRLLLVEDEEEFAALLRRLLEHEGFVVEHAADGQQGLHLGLSRRYEVMILDRRLPAIEGLELLTRLRRNGVGTPALLLTAKGTLPDRVAGLMGGADDYLVKPFAVEELLARLHVLLRRHADAAAVLAVGRWRLDVAARLASRDGASVALTERETALLAVLARRPGQVFSREALLRSVFDGADATTVVDTYVHLLRRKLGRQVVRTVRGVGYQLGRS